MTTRVTFDNPTFSDAITKAGRIPPNKGPAFDKAGGIVLIVDTASKLVIVRATDLDVTYEQHIYAQEASGDSVIWRLPAALLTGLAGALPQGEGACIDFIDRGDSWIRFVAGSLKSRIAPLDANAFPNLAFNTYEIDGMVPAQELANKVEQVAWACDDKGAMLSGVHFDGEFIMGVSQARFAYIPCEVAIDEPVTVPLKPLAQLIKGGTDIRLRVADKKLQLILDGETRTTSTVIEGNFPDMRPIMRQNFLFTVQVHRANLIETLNRLMVLVRNVRIPTLRVEVDTSGFVKMLTFDMDVEGVGRMQDSIDVETTYQGDSAFEIYFAPSMFIDCLTNSQADYINISFGVDDPTKDGKMHSIRFADDKNYTCYLMPKKP